MKNDLFWELQRTLSAEFSKYVLSHSEIDEKIPDGAQIVFNLKDNPEFNEWALRTARSQQEAGQPLVMITVAELIPLPISRLVNPELRVVSSI
ncbi:MAG: hypothetical protein KKF00_05640 [Proteobacteria bacterium]|nr:hypothetical protein [Pseudomonadota bacterium]